MPDKSRRTTTGMSDLRSFRRLLGYETGAWREGYAEIRLVVTTDHMNRMGKVHGGVYATLLDAAMGHCTTWCPVPGNTRTCVTVSLTTSFLKGVDAGVLTAIGRLQSVNGRIATATAEIRNDTGVLCAVGQASFSYGPGSEHLAGIAKKRD